VPALDSGVVRVREELVQEQLVLALAKKALVEPAPVRAKTWGGFELFIPVSITINYWQ
jgi:hypothetical protein